MAIKRKPRKKTSIKNMDLLKPVDISRIGTQDDPCFGKHYDARAKECIRCGDCELCLIVMGQKLHKKRASEEKTTKFKDVEEEAIYQKNLSKNPKKLRKAVQKDILVNIQRAKKITKTELITHIYMAWTKDGITQDTIKKWIKKLQKNNNPQFCYQKPHYIWNK